MRVMLLGATGMLGRDLAATAPSTVHVTPLSRAELDITDAQALARAVRKIEPDVIMNAAAYTLVDRAESERRLAFLVNSDGVGAIGDTAMAIGAVVVHFSSDYVFDGTSDRPYREDAPTNPVNAYGESKLAGEARLAQSGADYLLVRTQWLFGVNGRSFPRTMWERARRGEATRVVADQIGRPTYATDLAAGVWRLLAGGARGVFHLTNAGSATWHDVAQRIFSALGPSHLLSACTSADYPTPARRPRYSVLDTRKAEQTLCGALAPWAEALDRFLHQLDATQPAQRS